jgi:hypothetical protein
MSESADRRLLGFLLLIVSLAWMADVPSAKATQFFSGALVALGALVAVSGKPMLKVLADRVQGASAPSP